MLWWTVRKLKSRSSFDRWKAARALGAKPSPRAIAPLVSALGDEKEDVCIAAEEALVRIGQAAIEALAGALNSEKANASSYAAAALGKINDAASALKSIRDKRAVEPLLAALNDEEIEVRKAAAWVLGNLGDKRALEPLLATLHDKRWEMQKAAAQALGLIGDAQAIDHLILAMNDDTRHIPIDAADALGQIGDARAAEALLAVLNTDSGIGMKLSAGASLVHRGDARAALPLARLAKQERDSQQSLGLLTKLLDRHVAEVPMPDLQEIAQLDGLTRLCHSDWCSGRDVEYTDALDCNQVRQLARQELIRRGLDA